MQSPAVHVVTVGEMMTPCGEHQDGTDLLVGSHQEGVLTAQRVRVVGAFLQKVSSSRDSSRNGAYCEDLRTPS